MHVKHSGMWMWIHVYLIYPYRTSASKITESVPIAITPPNESKIVLGSNLKTAARVSSTSSITFTL